MVAPIQDVAQALVDEENAKAEAYRPLEDSGSAMNWWVGRLVSNGVTKELCRDLSLAVGQVTIPLRFMRTGPTRFELQHTLFQGTDDELFALAMVRIIAEGFTDKVHRCALKECRKYFVGDPRARWCSTTCGSKYRVRKKRRKDKRR